MKTRVRFRGSSPLARGLQLVILVRGLRRGIIPARAGFTSLAVCAASLAADHPRSRGVYLLSRVSVAYRRGSSPLARGLRLNNAGIRHLRVDHPRSRGVYGDLVDRLRAAGGSSPLARGLLVQIDEVMSPIRIIPARAGFTRLPHRECHDCRDHPRSRGVYTSTANTTGWRVGSSPLARGLRPAVIRAIEQVRIIPARAGFTLSGPPSSLLIRDHPRSRGVYSHPAITFPVSGGSSPLARGLPLSSRVNDAIGGIIPARAGFTAPLFFLGDEPGDHPRSRGVYPSRALNPSRARGSSPLARGLHPLRSSMSASCGIIPARAGFTSRPSATD